MATLGVEYYYPGLGSFYTRWRHWVLNITIQDLDLFTLGGDTGCRMLWSRTWTWGKESIILGQLEAIRELGEDSVDWISLWYMGHIALIVLQILSPVLESEGIPQVYVCTLHLYWQIGMDELGKYSQGPWNPRLCICGRPIQSLQQWACGYDGRYDDVLLMGPTWGGGFISKWSKVSNMKQNHFH